MTTQRLRPIYVDDLLATLFADAVEIRSCCARWVLMSPRFPAFLDVYRDKIRKKLRGVADGEGVLDLQVELLTAASLLTERKLTLEYEKYAANKTRGPDFTALYKTHTPFNVEVKRIRGLTQPGKWADVLCDKLRQLPPSVVNVLVVYGERAEQAAPFDVDAAMRGLRATAERKDELFFTRRGLEGARDYLRQSFKLSAVIYKARDAATDEYGPSAIWINPQARHPLPSDLRATLPRSLDATR